MHGHLTFEVSTLVLPRSVRHCQCACLGGAAQPYRTILGRLLTSVKHRKSLICRRKDKPSVCPLTLGSAARCAYDLSHGFRRPRFFPGAGSTVAVCN